MTLSSGTYGLGWALKVHALALRAAMTIFGITPKLQYIYNSHNNKLIIIYT